MNATSTAPGIAPVTCVRPAVDIAATEKAAQTLLHALARSKLARVVDLFSAGLRR